MSPSAQRVQIDFARLAGEESGTLYFEQLLRLGFDAWPKTLQHRYPALRSWQGLAHLKRGMKQLTGAGPNSRVLVASRSAELMRFASAQFFGPCRNVMTTDLSWPNYQRILQREARRTGNRVTLVRLRRQLIRDRLDCRALIVQLVDAFVRCGCDGLFLPAVDNLGVRLPVGEIVRAIARRAEIRFVVVDGAQAIGHVPLQLAESGCDMLLAGCHKWLRAYNPMGVAFYGHPRTAQSLDTTLRRWLKSRRIDDPLLRISQELEGERLSRYGETVNLLPLFTAQGAVNDALRHTARLDLIRIQQTANADRLFELASDTHWTAVQTAECLRSGICLLQASRRDCVELSPERMRMAFHELGLAVTTYRSGLVRLSMPTAPWTEEEQQRLAACLAAI